MASFVRTGRPAAQALPLPYSLLSESLVLSCPIVYLHGWRPARQGLAAGDEGCMKALKAGPPTFKLLPPIARTYVVVVVATGAMCLMAAAIHLRFEHPGLFALLLALAMATSAAKIDLPLGRSQSNLSLSHASTSGRCSRSGPPRPCASRRSAPGRSARCASAAQPAASHRLQHRIADPDRFARGAAAAAGSCMGCPGPRRARPHRRRRRAALFLREYRPGRRRRSRSRRGSRCRGSGIATSCGARRAIWPAPRSRRSRRRRPPRLVRLARAAGGAALSRLPQLPHGRRAAARRAGRDAPRDGRAAGDDRSARARDRSQGRLHARAHPIDPAVRGDAGRSRRAVRRRRAGGAHRGAAARRREHGGSRAHSVEARGAHARRVRARQDPSARRRRHPAERAVRRAGQRAGALPSRAVGRPRLPGGPARQRHSDSARASWRLPIATARCRPTVRTVPRAAKSEAIALLREYAGTAFDPALVELLIARLNVSAAAVAADPPKSRRGTKARSSTRCRTSPGAHREEQTLYEIAQALGLEPGRLRCDGADSGQGQPPGSVRDLCAVPRRRHRRLCLPVCAWARHRSAVQVGAASRGARSRLRLPSCADGRGAHGEELIVAAALPAAVRRPVHRRAGDLSQRRRLLHRRAPSRPRPRERTGRRGDLQLDALRADAARVAYRSADRSGEPPVARPSVRNRARARRAHEGHHRRGRARSRSAEGNQRHLRPRGGRPRASDDWIRAEGHGPSERSVRALCRRRFVVVLWDCSPEHEAQRVLELQNAVAAHPFEPRPGVRLSLSISAGPARFPTDGTTFEELLATADERMYRDKAGRRSRHSSRHALAVAQTERA